MYEDASAITDGMNSPCPICNSPFSAYVRDVPTRRTKRHIALYTCLDCQSFWNPSGYCEDNAQLDRDLEWGIGVAERNRSAAKRLFDKLAGLGVRPKSVAEIGCGIGTLLSVAQGMGKQAFGFDVNARAIEYARTRYGLDASNELWTADTVTARIDLYLCISVLEHISAPRPLIENLCRAALKHRAALFISVPFVERPQWPFILDPAPEKPGTPFFDNDVHVTHFSIEGLRIAMKSFGIVDTRLIDTGLWHGLLWIPSAAPGPLKRAIAALEKWRLSSILYGLRCV